MRPTLAIPDPQERDRQPWGHRVGSATVFPTAPRWDRGTPEPGRPTRSALAPRTAPTSSASSDRYPRTKARTARWHLRAWTRSGPTGTARIIQSILPPPPRCPSTAAAIRTPPAVADDADPTGGDRSCFEERSTTRPTPFPPKPEPRVRTCASRQRPGSAWSCTMCMPRPTDLTVPLHGGLPPGRTRERTMDPAGAATAQPTRILPPACTPCLEAAALRGRNPLAGNPSRACRPPTLAPAPSQTRSLPEVDSHSPQRVAPHPRAGRWRPSGAASGG